jgi:acetate---CoA ligase (ADP-forming)
MPAPGLPRPQTDSLMACGPYQLSDGRKVWLRPLRADDATRLEHLFHRLSRETVRLRFLRPRVTFDRQEAQALADVDEIRHVAIAALIEDRPESPIVAVGRFHGDGSNRAEVALVVEDAYQHIGLGRLLLLRLLEEARRRHLQHLDGTLLYENKAVLRLLRSTGHSLEVRHQSGDVLMMRIAVAVAPPEQTTADQSCVQ